MPVEIASPRAIPTVDDLIRIRRIVLWLMFVSFGLSGLTTVVEKYHHGHLTHGLYLATQVADGIGIVVAIIWLGSQLRQAFLANQNPSAARRLNDELYEAMGTKATRAALLAMVGCQFLIFFISKFSPFRADLGALISIFVGLETLLGALLYLDRDT